MRLLSASLTDVVSWKTSATSGARRIKLVPSRYCLAYLPRTPPFMDAKSYSGRSSSVGLTSLVFIVPSFMWGCWSRRDDSNRRVTIRVSNNQQAPSCGLADRNIPKLADRMIGIREGVREGIAEHGCRFCESDSMFFSVLLFLNGIPFESHGQTYSDRYIASTGQWERTNQGYETAAHGIPLYDYMCDEQGWSPSALRSRPSPHCVRHR